MIIIIGTSVQDRKQQTRKNKEKHANFSDHHTCRFFHSLYPCHRLPTGIHDFSVVVQTEARGWFKVPYPEPLIEGASPQCRGKILGSKYPLGTGNWLLSPYTNPIVQQTPMPHIPMSIQPYASYTVRGWYEVSDCPNLLSWLPNIRASAIRLRSGILLGKPVPREAIA